MTAPETKRIQPKIQTVLGEWIYGDIVEPTLEEIDAAEQAVLVVLEGTGAGGYISLEVNGETHYFPKSGIVRMVIDSEPERF